MSIEPEEKRFAENTIIMSQAIHDSVTRLYKAGYKTVDPMMILLASNVISKFDQHYLIQGFIENSHDKCWDCIKERNEEYFVQNSTEIFKYLPMDKVNLFKDLFLTTDVNGNNVISQSLKNQIWELLDAMIKISIKYIHKGRSPYSYSTNNGFKNTYGASFFDEVDLTRHANNWNVKLYFPPNY